LLKLADQLRFVKENGRYYIECTYPEIPEGYEWGLGITIFNKMVLIPHILRLGVIQMVDTSEGSFKKTLQILLI